MTTPRARGPGTVNAGPWWGTSMCAVQGAGCQGQGGGAGGGRGLLSGSRHKSPDGRRSSLGGPTCGPEV